MITCRFVKEKLLDGSFSFRPKIPVTLIGRETSMKFLAVLDSGADISVIPRTLADFLGVRYDLKTRTSFLGFGKEVFDCAIASVDILFHGKQSRLSEKLENVPVLIALTGDEKEPVLGCDGVFDSFNISFLQRRKIKISRTQRIW